MHMFNSTHHQNQLPFKALWKVNVKVLQIKDIGLLLSIIGFKIYFIKFWFVVIILKLKR